MVRAALILAIAATATSSASAEPPCASPAAHYRGGRQVGSVCPSEAASRGLTIIDLGDAWAPRPLRAGDQAGDAPDYLGRFVALANEDPSAMHSDDDRYLDLYGILPTLGVIRTRMQQQDRYACHAAVEGSALGGLAIRLAEESTANGKARVAADRNLRRSLEAQIARRSLQTLDELAVVSQALRRQVERLAAREARTGAIRAAQEHLACDGLLGKRYMVGVLNWQTAKALELYQRRHFLAPTAQLDVPTQKVMLRNAGESDVLAALRVLRERVGDASGLIEDGSASLSESTIAGRLLGDLDLITPHGHEALPGGAPDLLGRATNQVTGALGWTTIDSIRSFLASHTDPDGKLRLRVAVTLPPAPAYHTSHMELEAVIDPSDAVPTKRPGRRKLARRPALTVYAVRDGERIPLVHWPTTVGGWQDKRFPGGYVRKEYMGSDFGDFVWRDLYIAPRWLPPDNTPDDDVVKRGARGWYLDRELLGPSFRSAYGMAMLIHHRVSTHRDKTTFIDRGVRTHGTGNILSLDRADSHGCHRLLGIHASRLGTFLLAHRNHVRHGPVPTLYRRVFRYKGRFPVTIRQRGYLYELTPPVPVHVGRPSE